jgi:hypothetical protein
LSDSSGEPTSIASLTRQNFREFSEHPPGRPITIRSSKYLNNLIEQDHRAIKSRIGPMLGFKDFVSAQITLAGVELVHRIRQGQFALRKLGVAKKTAPEIWNASARRLRRKAFKIHLGLHISTLHQSRYEDVYVFA